MYLCSSTGEDLCPFLGLTRMLPVNSYSLLFGPSHSTWPCEIVFITSLWCHKIWKCNELFHLQREQLHFWRAVHSAAMGLSYFEVCFSVQVWSLHVAYALWVTVCVYVCDVWSFVQSITHTALTSKQAKQDQQERNACSPHTQYRQPPPTAMQSTQLLHSYIMYHIFITLHYSIITPAQTHCPCTPASQVKTANMKQGSRTWLPPKRALCWLH